MSGIIRMYKRDGEGVLHFREAWFDDADQHFVINYGVVGHQSTTDAAAVEEGTSAAGLLAAFEAQCEEDGYTVIPDSEQFRVVAQFALKSKDGTERDRHLEQKAKEVITAELAWRGLGVVEGSGMGNSRLNIFCLCPDVNKAVNAIKVCARAEDLDFTKLTIAAAPASDPDAFKVKHSPRQGGGFTL
ncbi:hypothetical protein [Paenarthrobacter sp. NCHU4564]|uniref:hypothetical protein n=1 Tax=Paenarthrobacter sp. NCHU4564 TaxID=3451353 RepID=UPI003F9BAE1D